MTTAVLLAMVLACCLYGASGHGMVLDPVNRASRWRDDPSAPVNFDDNGLFCGGFAVQWFENEGKCGLCGDNFADPTPRRYELGGILGGEGTVVKSYSPGGAMPVRVLVTANHMGFFRFDLCNLDKYSVESEDCFAAVGLLQTNGERKYVIDESIGYFNLTLRIPEDLVCEHCVLQWTWTTGNSWGECGEDKEGQVGCGQLQETFRTCSDISILPDTTTRSPVTTERPTRVTTDPPTRVTTGTPTQVTTDPPTRVTTGTPIQVTTDSPTEETSLF